ncbi:hypothetical protein NKH34_09105 [Mesorhizobium sp. M1148]|uniref:hypothetical protein n=1 Tax=unclassified Mesorhizobium TaxID=325217 RepID=UPI003336C5A2
MDTGQSRNDKFETLLDETQLAVRLGISPKTLRNLAYIKIGGLVRYRLPETTRSSKAICAAARLKTAKRRLSSKPSAHRH